jgi:ABC-type spermidine/putrescine transport system permease subunit II
MSTPTAVTPPTPRPGATPVNDSGAAESSRFHRLAFPLQLGLPLTFWIVVLGIPYVLMAMISFWPNSYYSGMHAGFSMHSWTTVFRVPLYRQALVRSLEVAAIVTVLCVLIGYPSMSRCRSRSGPPTSFAPTHGGSFSATTA